MPKIGSILTLIALIASLAGNGWMYFRLDKKIDQKSNSIMAHIDSNAVQKKIVDSLILQSALSKAEVNKSTVRIVYLKSKRDSVRPAPISGIEEAKKTLGL